MKTIVVTAMVGVVLLSHMARITHGHNILVAAPVSTVHVKDALCDVAKSLVHRGHQVSMLTSYPPTFSHRNLTIIKVSPKLHLLQNLDLFTVNSSVLEAHTVAVLNAVAKAMWDDRPDKRSRDSLQPAAYDALIIPEFLNEIVYPFLKDFKGAIISFYSQGAEHYIVSNSNHYEDLFLSVNPTMDAPYFGSYPLKDRFLLSLLVLNGTDLKQTRIHPHVRKVLKTFSPRFSGLDDFLLQSRVSLLDAHRLLDGPPAGLQPWQVEVAGLGIRNPQSLLKEIETMLKIRKAKGMIYVSLGSYTKSSYIPTSLKEALLETLGQLPYLALWQYDGVDLQNKDNVYKRKVMPQQDVLGDNRTILFISYCSASAVQQALHHGVPVLALPVALDQANNAKKLENLGVAKILDWRTVTTDSLVEAASELLTDSAYGERMRRISKLIRDQPESAADQAAWWVEYAIRRAGDAPPIQTSTLEIQTVCDAHLLGLWAAVAALLGLTVGTVLTLFCFCFYIFCCVSPGPKRKSE